MKSLKQVERVPNKYGIMIKKCCASCQHKCLDDFARRHCNLTRRPVRAGYVCGDWEMSSKTNTEVYFYSKQRISRIKQITKKD